ncbi:thioredoxin domain-containing protein [Streptomyces sp. NPDC096136]|uniref:thioredoxin domain-containing protein n=1 Tax=Streptomyces sp. NPDC096136 TaxID=3366076 RepID=UPI003813F8B7
MASGGKKDRRRGARERLLAEREEEARRVRRRGRLLVGGALVAVLALAAGVGLYASRSAGSGAGEAGGKPFVRPAHTAGEDGVVVPYGRQDAKDLVSVWLDPRCPFCAGVETGLGAAFKERADAGDYRVEYHFATFLDGALGGKGSKRALNALGAAVNEDPGKFMDYLRVLYENHPERESDDRFGSTATLLDLAGRVPGLRGPGFDAAVEELTYMPWVDRVARAFHRSGKKGAPVVEANGEEVGVLTGRGLETITPEAFGRLVAAHPRT